MKKVDECPVCHGRRFRPFAMASAQSVLLHFAQVRCLGCDLLVAQPQASEDEIARFYARSFYEEIWPDPRVTDNEAPYRADELPLMRRLWADWPPPDGAAAVEVGCGNGEMLQILAAQGFAARGCDPGVRAVAYCRSRGLDVVEGRWPGLPFAPASFDVAVTLQVVEHVIDPLAFLREVVGLVRPGGVVVVATEDAWTSQTAWERTWQRLRGRVPEFRSATDHTYLFQARHLRQLMMGAGCSDVRTRSYSRVPGHENLHWRVYKTLFRTLDRVLGHGDFLMAVGRRA
jgi:SAM-dependent methyltransferase